MVQTAFLGDVILSLPFIYKLISKGKVTLIVRKGVGDLLKSIEGLTVFEVIKGNASSYKSLLKSLACQRYDIAFCLHGSFRSAFFLSKIEAKVKLGYKKNLFTDWAFDLLIKRQMNWPEPMRVMQMLQPFKALFPLEVELLSNASFDYLNTKDPFNTLPMLPQAFKFYETNQEQFRLPRVVFFHGSQWRTKRWPIENFLVLQKWFEKKGYQVFWMGTSGEAEELNQFPHVILSHQILSGKISLLESFSFLRETSIVVSNDSGGGHMGAWAGCKVITVYGPTSLKFGYRPWADHVLIIENDRLSCRPCHHHGPNTCPLSHHKCMNELTIQSQDVMLTRFI